MHEHQIDVANIQILERDAQGLGRVVMPLAPELRHNGDLGPGNTTIPNCTANDMFYPVVLCGIDETIACLEGVNYQFLKGLGIFSAEATFTSGWLEGRFWLEWELRYLLSYLARFPGQRQESRRLRI